MIVLEIGYMVSALLLALLGFNALLLSVIYWLKRYHRAPSPGGLEGSYPTVAVQLPIYNERHVVERLVECIGRLNYPRDRLVVQLLDDSTDETVTQAAAAAEALRRSGFPIEHIRRGERSGYKAGALAYGLTRTDAEFIAVFDADFSPPPDFLCRVIPYFLRDDTLGLVQTRWSHLNAEHSLLTRAQALALDAHFVVEQTARNRSYLLMNFSGTGGIWRRDCIEASGGWHTDTLSEDIDLSYRAQLAGWRFLYLPDIDSPAEIPPLMMAFKRQQGRWATGTVQCLRKLGRRVLFSRLNPWQKLEAFLHLGGYFVHPLMILVLLFSLPLLWADRMAGLPLAGLGLGMLGMPVQIWIAQRYLYPDWLKRIAVLPVLILIGLGIAVSNTGAVLRGLSPKPVAFSRTPKFRIEDRQPGHAWQASGYVLTADTSTWIEIAFAFYAAVTFIAAVQNQSAAAVFMALYALGFTTVAATSLWQAHVARQKQAAQRRTWSFSGSGGD